MFYRIKEFGCKPTVRIYNHLLDALLGESENRYHMIDAVYENMNGEGLEPNVFTYNILLKALCKNGKLNAACKLLVGLWLGRGGNVAEAVAVCDRMEKDCFCPLNVTAYSTLVHGFAKAGDLQGASEVWNRMVNCEVQPHVVVYTPMVDVLCKNSMLDQAYRLIDNMVADGCPPNVVIFITFIKGLCHGGRVRWAMHVVDQMQRYGCLPDTRTYNELLDGLFSVNEFRKACELIRELEERKVELNLVTYNTFMYGFSSHGKEEWVLQVLGRMFVNGVKPDAITVNVIIYAYSKLGKVITAIQFLERITAGKELCPDIIAHTSLLWGICNSLGIEEAIVYLNKMLNKGIFPNIATWDGYFQQYVTDDLVTIQCTPSLEQDQWVVCVIGKNTW
ncbi:hypothetical protein JHK84_054724 [Glycine max]|nr:hypothetical protein JHK84_054724 [Glycine max]